MAGPAIRAFHIAEELADGARRPPGLDDDVFDLTDPAFECLFADDEALRDIVDWADVVIFQGFVMFHAPWIADTNKIIVVDIYDPMHLEQLEQLRGRWSSRTATSINAATDRRPQRPAASAATSSSARASEQRHFWLGQLAAAGPAQSRSTTTATRRMRSLLDVAPFGLQSAAPMRTRQAIKGVVPGISEPTTR